jgi:hypothetical protein
MIDVSIRLRRAIYLNDLVLVRRIVKNHPLYLQNPDEADKVNTSLHLAAQLGFSQIAVRISRLQRNCFLFFSFFFYLARPTKVPESPVDVISIMTWAGVSHRSRPRG